MAPPAGGGLASGDAEATSALPVHVKNRGKLAQPAEEFLEKMRKNSIFRGKAEALHPHPDLSG
jgi:hypothetical protein